MLYNFVFFIFRDMYEDLIFQIVVFALDKNKKVQILLLGLVNILFPGSKKSANFEVGFST